MISDQHMIAQHTAYELAKAFDTADRFCITVTTTSQLVNVIAKHAPYVDILILVMDSQQCRDAPPAFVRTQGFSIDPVWLDHAEARVIDMESRTATVV